MQHLVLAVRHYPSSFSCVTVLPNRIKDNYRDKESFHESIYLDENKKIKIGFTTKPE